MTNKITFEEFINMVSNIQMKKGDIMELGTDPKCPILLNGNTVLTDVGFDFSPKVDFNFNILPHYANQIEQLERIIKAKNMEANS